MIKLFKKYQYRLRACHFLGGKSSDFLKNRAKEFASFVHKLITASVSLGENLAVRKSSYPRKMGKAKAHPSCY